MRRPVFSPPVALPPPSRALVAFVVGLLGATVGMRPAAGADAAFVIQLDRDAVAPGEAFACEVTLTVAGEEVDGFRPPEFKSLRILSAPQFPSRSTQMQIGGGQTVVQNSYTWRYELMVPPGAKGPFVIGAARARLAGREVRSNSVTVRLGASTGPRGQAGHAGPGAFPFDLFGGRPAEPPVSSSAGTSFIRVVADKSRVYVGETVVVGWFLYTTQRLDKFDAVTEARTDGFWSEEIPQTTPKGRLAYTQETLGGREYQVAALFQKALFPLREGKLTISPMEAEVAQVDFFGTALRTQRLKAEPVVIEAIPLPREDQPRDFDVSNVGKYALTARADRTTVSVGEAVTVTLEIKGTGNVRNVRPPALPDLPGWKSYQPKITVNLDTSNGIGGTKLLEVLLLPERAGTVTIPALELPTFDAEAKRYVTTRSEPLRLDVTGDAAPAARAPGAAGPGVENVITAAIRPIRARSRLTRDVGTTFLHSRAFRWLLFAPPLALGLTVLIERTRERLAVDSRRTRRRRMRRLVRRRLGAAEAHRDAGRKTEFYIEIDRVLRDVLAARLGRTVSGLRRDELAELLHQRGMPADATVRVLSELEVCDQARFAPGGEAAAAAAMAAALERADELIGVIEKAALREEGRA
jgi:hypothetical protein